MMERIVTEQDKQIIVPETPKIITLADNFIPEVDPLYIPFGFFNDLKGIIESKIFYTAYITGLSGNGKTKMVEQACAHSKREYIRVNITKDTDEFDLIGAYELVNGDTVWRDGPVLIALKRGAILLLDETDLGSERLLCMQPILEGIGYFNKKRAEFIPPSPGFNVMATANTKGRGSDDGKFIGTNPLNEAFLERFAITVEQEYPSEKTERKILEELFKTLDHHPAMNVDKFSANLTKWAELLRKSYADGATDEIISTRRLVHIAKAYSIFKNRKKALELCLNRFDNEIKTTFMDFYSKIDPDLDKKIPGPNEVVQQTITGDLAQDLVLARKAAQEKAKEQAAIATGAQTKGIPSGLIVFGDARNVAAVSTKYKQTVKVIRDKTTGDATVTVLGTQVTVKATDIMTSTDDLLDKVVAKIVARKGSQSVMSTGDEEEDE
jgi:AAA domain (dynein-related subfamily)